jgi:hypothetical protein
LSLFSTQRSSVVVWFTQQKFKMAPSKQSLLSLGVFMKNPKVSTQKKHQKLENKAFGVANRKKPYVDKKREQRIKEENEISDGAEGWRKLLVARGVQNPESMRLDLMFLGNGPAPDLQSALNDVDENHIDFIEEIHNCKQDS